MFSREVSPGLRGGGRERAILVCCYRIGAFGVASFGLRPSSSVLNRHPSPDEQIARAEGRQKRFRCQSGTRGCTAGCDAEDVRDDCVEDLRDPRFDLPHQTSSQSSCSEISKQPGQQNKDIYSAVSRRLFWPELPKCMENGHDRSIYIFPVPLTHQVRWY